jgi:hypothetical protein
MLRTQILRLDLGKSRANSSGLEAHYDREVSTVHWATSTTGNPIVSYDEGKTWTTFTPDGSAMVPKTDTVQNVYIGWKKVEG